jgi:hypothetical protein
VWRGRNRFLGCSKTSEKSKDVTSKIDRCAQHNRETGDCRSKREWEDGFDELIKREDGGGWRRRKTGDASHHWFCGWGVI